MAALQCANHLTPVAAASVVVGLNLKKIYNGQELSDPTYQDTKKLAALQFAAKLHEVMMLASISAIVFAHICKELIIGNGVPFATFFVSLQIETISLLWSPELGSMQVHLPATCEFNGLQI